MRRLAAALLCGILVATATVNPVQAQDVSWFTEGPWTGHMMISGTTATTIDGVPITFTTDLDGYFALSVLASTEDDDQEIGNESVVLEVEGGMWQLGGDAHFTGVIPGQGDGESSWDIDGSGGVEGLPSAPLLTGSASTTNGVLTSTGTAGSRTQTVPDQTDPVRLELVVESANCFELYGTLDLEVAGLNLAAQGGGAAFRGTWAAYLDQGALNEAIADWTAELRTVALVPGAQVDPPANLPEVARMMGNIILAHNDWVDQSQGPVGKPFFQHTAALMNDSAIFLARLRNLSACEEAVLDPSLIEKFTTIAQRSLLLKGATIAENRELDANKLFILAGMALNAGALGSGAPQPDGERFENAVRAQVERILNDNVILGSEDGSGQDGLDLNPDVKKLLALAAHMNWEVEVLGVTYNAADLWAAAVALNAPPGAGEDGDGG